MTRNIFVAGGTGVLGRRVVPALLRAGHEVTANCRSDEARRRLVDAGARPAEVDLFDAEAVTSATYGHDTVINLATSIPSGARAIRPSAWTMNDRLRTEAAAHLASAASHEALHYVGESITFPYVDSGDEWIVESCERTYFPGNASCVDAEAVAASVTAAGGVGVALRFAMFFADDSAHIDMYRSLARRGLFGVTGRPEALMSFVHVDDAAAAVVAAIEAPAGIYNVAEPEPMQRDDHRRALARASGRRLRALPTPMLRLGGAALESISRSQRISSTTLTSATGWTPLEHVIDHWG